MHSFIVRPEKDRQAAIGNKKHSVSIKMGVAFFKGCKIVIDIFMIKNREKKQQLRQRVARNRNQVAISFRRSVNTDGKLNRDIEEFKCRRNA